MDDRALPDPPPHDGPDLSRLPRALLPAQTRTLRRVKGLGQGLTAAGVAATAAAAAGLLLGATPFLVGILVGGGGAFMLSSALLVYLLGRCPVCGHHVGAAFDTFCTHCGVRLRDAASEEPEGSEAAAPS